MKYSKLFSALLVICLLITPVLVACETDDGEGGTSGSSSRVEESDAYTAQLSGDTYDGETVTFLTCGPGDQYESEILFNTYDGWNEADIFYPEALNNDLGERANRVTETLGVELEEIQIKNDSARPGGTMYSYIYNASMAELDFDIVVPCLYDGAALAIEGLLYDLNSIEGLDLDEPWWNQEFRETMTFGGKFYFAIGDIGIVNKNHTAVLYVNLDLWNAYGLSEESNFGASPYDLVRQGKWTVDLVFEASKTMSADLDRNGYINYLDEFGWGGQLDDTWSLFFGTGERVAKAGADGFPYFSMYTERSSKFMDKMQEHMRDKDHCVTSNDYFSVSASPDDLVREAFTDRRCMFYNNALGEIFKIGRDMEDHFAIVPVPKGDEQQESHYSLVNPWNATCIAVPLAVDPERLPMIADVLDLMGAESLNTVAISYQEILDYMKTRDDESKEMLNEYILPTRGSDVGLVFRWGSKTNPAYNFGMGTLLQQMATKPIGTFASEIQRIQDGVRIEMQNTIEAFKQPSKKN